MKSGVVRNWQRPFGLGYCRSQSRRWDVPGVRLHAALGPCVLRYEGHASASAFVVACSLHVWSHAAGMLLAFACSMHMRV